MATVTGSLIDASGAGMPGVPIEFILTTAPLDATSTLVSGKPVRITTGASGTFSTVLRQAVYRVRIPSSPELSITVPSGSGSHTIGSIVTSGSFVTPGSGATSAVTVTWFTDIGQMLDADSANWTIGRTLNSYGTDGIISSWTVLLKADTASTGVVANGDSILESTDGDALVIRS